MVIYLVQLMLMHLTVTGGSLTDGTATLNSGALSGVTTVH